MSATELRQAAETLQARARGATPGVWGVGNRTDIVTDVEQHSRGSYSATHTIARLDDMDYDEDYVEPRENGATEEDDASYIALMQPSLGVALAEALDYHAEDHDAHECEAEDECPLLPVARLINGGAA